MTLGKPDFKRTIHKSATFLVRVEAVELQFLLQCLGAELLQLLLHGPPVPAGEGGGRGPGPRGEGVFVAGRVAGAGVPVQCTVQLQYSVQCRGTWRC